MKSDQPDECILCCREINIYAIGGCDHPVCYLCFTRLKVLCEVNYCTICRSESPIAIFTKHCSPFLEVQNKFTLFNKKYKIIFEDRSTQEAFQSLLENECKTCEEIFPTFPKLQEHMRKNHELFYCELCNENLKMFSFEKRYYNRKDLATHKRLGDRDDTSQRGHPLCEFCDKRYMDKDDLFRHLRKDHFFCHFCDVDGKHQYYNDYEYLRSHFRTEHYLCEEDDCLHEQFTSAFRTEIDLKAHIAVQHSKNKSKAEAKQARVLEFEFSYAPSIRPTGSSSPRGGRYSHNRRRNVDENNAQSQSKSQPEVEKPNTTSVQDFPFLSEQSAQKKPVPDLTLSYSGIQSQPKRNYSAAPRRNVMSAEEFPALCPSSVPSGSGSRAADSNRQQPPAAHAPRNTFATTSSHRTVPDQNGNSSARRESQAGNGKKSTRQQQEATRWGGGSKRNLRLEEEFPSLEIRNTRPPPASVQSSRTSSAPAKSPERKVEKGVPMETNSPEPEPKRGADQGPTSEDRFVVIKSKSKKKKNKEYVPPPPASDADAIAHLSNGTSTSETDGVDSEGSRNCQVHPKLRAKQKVYKEFDTWQEEVSFARDDFPPLAAGASNPGGVRRPPGFSAPKPKGPPPGFSSAPAPDPGIAMKTLGEIARETIRLGPRPADPPREEPPESGGAARSFIDPPHSRERNNRLFENIGSLPDALGFIQISREFRCDAVPVEEFHDKCLESFQSRYPDVFPELLCLLPDVRKQQELYAVHTRYLSGRQGGGARGKKSGQATTSPLVVCVTCSQVMLKSDCSSHQAEHAKARC